MSFYDNLEEICAKKGVSPNALIKKIGMSTYILTTWRRGSEPKVSTVNLIADALGVKPSDLIRTEDDNLPTDRAARAALFGDPASVTDEQWNEVKKFAEYVKQRDAAKK